MFKERFKYFKKNNGKLNFQEILNIKYGNHEFVSKIKLKSNFGCSKCAGFLGLKNIPSWDVYELNSHPGFIIIMNPFTNLGQRYWIARSIANYTKKPSATNLNEQQIQFLTDNNCDLWTSISQENSNSKRSIKKKLRWATMGYHHNWDTKTYSECRKSSIPSDLDYLSRFIIKVILGIDFKSEAAIVNFYHMDSYLSGHIDHSEVNLNAPLLSLSFGQSAIFLIGGQTLAENPDAVLIESGDIILMSGISRLQYHAVPKIIAANFEFWNCFNEDNEPTKNEITPSLKCLCSCVNFIQMNDLSNTTEDQVTFVNVKDAEYWKPFNEYIKTSRININVRQVLLAEQISL